MYLFKHLLLLSFVTLNLCLRRSTSSNTNFRIWLTCRHVCIDSQDTWTFQSPVQVNGIGFEVGRLRSDNRIAAQLMASNYRVINNPFVFKTHHLQMTEKRPGRTNQEQIPGRTSNVLLSVGF